MVNCVLISEEEGHVTNVEVSLKGDDLFRILKGTATFIGQLPETDVVIMKCDISYFELIENRNKLPEPYEKEVVFGPILLIRMDENADPQDFTLLEYLSWNPRVSV
jgi:hypothetical protein